jgi:hypothetical protein
VQQLLALLKLGRRSRSTWVAFGLVLFARQLYEQDVDVTEVAPLVEQILEQLMPVLGWAAGLFYILKGERVEAEVAANGGGNGGDGA